MNNESTKKQNITALAPKFAKLFVKEPIFMFFCPVKSKREDFAEKYFAYYLNKWQENSQIILSSGNNVLGVLENPDEFKYKFYGKKSFGLIRSRFSYNILNHQEIVQDIINIVIPEQMDKRLLTIYACAETPVSELKEVISAAVSKAKEEKFVLAYETFSKRFVPVFEECGFETGYARQFLNTQFFQTVMTYNI